MNRGGQHQVTHVSLLNGEWSGYEIHHRSKPLRPNERMIESGLKYKDARRLIKKLISIEKVMES
jgi:hypothetical protein